MIFSANQIAELLTKAGETPRYPTPEQVRIIEAELNTQTLVIAGAGSGKTETISQRVVWLIANNKALPEEILGLTFTVKAAGELAERVTGRIELFLANAQRKYQTLQPEQQQRVAELIETLKDGFATPAISTYNSFGAAVIAEYGAAIGVGQNTKLIDDAEAKLIAREIVRGSDSEIIAAADKSVSTLADYVVQLDAALSEHLREPAEIEPYLAEVIQTQELVKNPAAQKRISEGKPLTETQKTPLSDIKNMAADLQLTGAIIELVNSYRAHKKAHNLVQFSDQIAYAVQIIEQLPIAKQTIRKRYPVVLLDEVQDTSVSQTRLLSAIFAGSSVMGVGDPHQSIYAWRGAAADSLGVFLKRFRGAETATGQTMSLSISWRNPKAVLDAANTIAQPLGEKSTVAVTKLRPKTVLETVPEAAQTGEQQSGEQPTAEHQAAEQVSAAYFETLREEAAAVADWFKTQRENHRRAQGEYPTAAIVLRNRANMQLFAQALHEREIPAEIVGVGGLLQTSEVTEIAALLRCVSGVDSDNALLRVLASPRFAVPVTDLLKLQQLARWFMQRDHRQRVLTDSDTHADRFAVNRDIAVSLVDAIVLALKLKADHAAWGDISETGKTRILEAAAVIANLRSMQRVKLTELIRMAETALNIDIELQAHPRSNTEQALAPRANVAAFIDAAAAYQDAAQDANLERFIAWLDNAETDNNLAEVTVEPSQHAVQIITGHGSKGLEWDLVAIPQLLTDVFPARDKDSKGWIRPGKLPDQLRGDKESLPEFNFADCELQSEVVQRFKEYQEANKLKHLDDERRLAYVAVTRSRDKLFLTGSYWGDNKTPREVSTYIEELQANGILSPADYRTEHEENPAIGDETQVQWPLDPLGLRADNLRRAAETYRSVTVAEGYQLPETIEILLREYQQQAQATPADGLKTGRINASALAEILADPKTAAENQLRPMPKQPFKATDLGNKFHSWVELRSTTHRGKYVELPGLLKSVARWEESIDQNSKPATKNSVDGKSARDKAARGAAKQQLLGAVVPDQDLQDLITTFEGSRFAQLKPAFVETEITVPFAGSTLQCKPDAVYRHESADREITWEVVDWKTGRAPALETDAGGSGHNALEKRLLQPLLYKHAFAKWLGVPTEQVTATLYYVASDEEIKLSDYPEQQNKTLAEIEAEYQRLITETAENPNS